MTDSLLSVEDLLQIARGTLDEVLVRDAGLLGSAVARPAATAFGQDAYPDLWSKAAALTHSIARNHSLVDGNKRLALAALYVMLELNGWRLTFSQDEAFDFITGIADGSYDDVLAIAIRLRVNTARR